MRNWNAREQIKVFRVSLGGENLNKGFLMSKRVKKSFYFYINSRFV